MGSETPLGLADLPDIFYRVRLEPRPHFEFISEAITDITGFSPQDYYADPDLPLKTVHPEDLPTFQHVLKHKWGRPCYTFRWQHRHGGWVWLEHHTVFGEGHDGDAPYHAGSARDVTARHWSDVRTTTLTQVGQALSCALPAQSVVQRLAKTLVSEFADVCVIDLEELPGQPHLCASAVSVRHAQQQRAALQEVVADSSLRPSTIARVFEHRQPLWTPRLQPADVEEIWRGPQHQAVVGSMAIHSLMVLPLLARDTLLGVISFLLTHTERDFDADDFAFAKDLARQVATFVDNALLYEASQAAVRARERVLAFVAHDLRAPLSAAGLNLEQIPRLLQASSPRLDRTLTRAQNALRSAHTMIDDLLDLSRLTHDTLRLNCSRVLPHELVRTTYELFAPQAQRAGVTLAIHTSPQLPAVWADAERLSRVLANLLGNALKFTAAQGQVELGAESQNETVRFWVQDTGRGIAPEQQAHLFDSFWQADPHDGRGAGLGLCISQALVQAHGGQLQVMSEVGVGSTFAFAVPLAP